MARDEKQTMLNRVRIISKELCIIGICLFAIILIYASYLYKYEESNLKDYLFALLNYFMVGIPLGYALWNFICGKEKRKQALLSLFAALFILTLENIEHATDYWEFVLYFWPLVAVTCFLAIMSRKSKSWKHLQLSTIPLYLFIVTIGFCVYRSRLTNLFIFPFWLIHFSCVTISLTLAFRDTDKVKIRVQRVLIIFCFFLLWLIYDTLRVGYKLDRLFQQIIILIWLVVAYAFANISERVKGIGRLFIYYAMVFGGMWLLAEPYISQTGLKWEVVITLYLFLTADVVIIVENRRQHHGSKKIFEYGAMVLINIGYLAFLAWRSNRIRNILHSFFTKTIGDASAWKH